MRAGLTTFALTFLLLACAPAESGSASAVPSDTPAEGVAAEVPATRAEEVRQAVQEMSVHASQVLLTKSGMGRSDYEFVAGEWLDYEPHWHTGQLIWALTEAGLLLDDPELIAGARRAGDWWVATEFKEPHPFAGLVNAWHGDKLGRLINWTTISDGTPGLFALSRATGDPVYADTATRSGQWLWENTRVPEDIENGQGLFYNLFDPERAAVLTDWNAHKQGLEYDAAEAARLGPPPITELARPNIEGFLFADMCEHTGDQVWCDRYLEKVDHALARQDENGLWMEFEPNNPRNGQVHPRFNIWNAEALLEAYDISGDAKYLEGAAKTARFFRDNARRDGTWFYRTKNDGSFERDAVTGSSVAFNGILMLRLKGYGYTEFDEAIERNATWIINNRFASDHPDPNLAGAVVNTRYRPQNGITRYVNRDVGTTFGIRFLVDYARALEGDE